MSFDALRYIASNPDLISAFGLDTVAATNHYNTVGINEGRPINFDALRYVASNPDLIAFFGLNTTAATTHYITNGFGEGRQVNFDALRYIASNPDLIGAFGTNTAAATSHYVTNGFTEGRQVNFNALRYIASNADLIGAFGTNTAAATSHYITNGFGEGRSTTGFDPAVYLRNHADLRNAFGNNEAAATQHYISAGVFEGRRITPFSIDLSDIANGTGGFVINGQCAGDYSGRSVSSAGDVNGDGLADLIVGARNSDPAGGSNAGRSYLIFGQTGTAGVNLSAVAAGSGGFVINGHCAGDLSGHTIASAGDINGDGLADVLVGAFLGDPATRTDAGRSYVVFGRTGGSAVDLSSVAAGTGGFVINGQCTSDGSGFGLSSAGDVNGDGLADLIVGAPYADPVSGRDAGRSYVVFGRTGSAAVNLSAIAAGSGGFVINGQGVNDSGGRVVAGAGDVNGDGLADLIVGTPFVYDTAGVPLNSNFGRSYVVFGKTAGAAINLSSVAAGTGGFVINRINGDYSGSFVSSAGDVNGDGLADLFVGCPRSSATAGGFAGRNFVVFGQTGSAAVNLSAIAAGTGGFVINGHCAADASGLTAAGAGDVNGDGLTDLIVGAYRSDPAAGSEAGRSYLVFGQTGGGAINLSAVASGAGGFVINGQCAGDLSGVVSSAGDVNGDGLADLIVGAYGNDPAVGGNAGRSYIIFGSTSGVYNQTAIDQLGDAGNNTLTGAATAETLVGGAGNDTLLSGGGADVLYGGSGNDTIVINASTVTALTSPFGAGGNTTQLARVDGGTGIDTLKLEGAGLTLNLNNIANQGAATPGSSSRLESIERIDITGSGNNTLTIGLRDVIDLGSFNTFTNATGWADGSYNLAAGGPGGANPEQRRQLVIDADAGDTVNITGWTAVGTVTNSGNTYTVYHQGTFAQLIIDNRATVIPG